MMGHLNAIFVGCRVAMISHTQKRGGIIRSSKFMALRWTSLRSFKKPLRKRYLIPSRDPSSLGWGPDFRCNQLKCSFWAAHVSLQGSPPPWLGFFSRIKVSITYTVSKKRMRKGAVCKIFLYLGCLLLFWSRLKFFDHLGSRERLAKPELTHHFVRSWTSTSIECSKT